MVDEVIDSKVGKFVTISKVNLYRGWFIGLKKSNVAKYKVSFIHHAYKRESTIYCNNVAMGLYWYLFDRLKLSHYCYVGIRRSEILELLKVCRGILNQEK